MPKHFVQLLETPKLPYVLDSIFLIVERFGELKVSHFFHMEWRRDLVRRWTLFVLMSFTLCKYSLAWVSFKESVPRICVWNLGHPFRVWGWDKRAVLFPELNVLFSLCSFRILLMKALHMSERLCLVSQDALLSPFLVCIATLFRDLRCQDCLGS